MAWEQAKSQLSRMNCQTFSTGLSSGHLAGSGRSVRFSGKGAVISPRTVDKHLEQIYAKPGVENRTAAAAIATNATRRNS
ncbi:hypothetical protein ABIA96_001377 [Bradyrhizobium sp. LB11.1]